MENNTQTTSEAFTNTIVKAWTTQVNRINDLLTAIPDEDMIKVKGAFEDCRHRSIGDQLGCPGQGFLSSPIREVHQDAAWKSLARLHADFRSHIQDGLRTGIGPRGPSSE